MSLRLKCKLKKHTNIYRNIFKKKKKQFYKKPTDPGGLKSESLN